MRVHPGLIVALSLGLLTSCTQETLEIVSVTDRQTNPLPPKMRQKLAKLNLSMSAPIMMRIFKEEEVLEVWKANSQDRYQLVATYPICAWSGVLGPKKKEGDRQAPEGFYQIAPRQMNPNSSYYLSFDIGYPNKYDRAYGRSGRNIMVHGACSSAGCYSMSDAAVLQIYAFARDAFKAGQKSFQVQAYPFRMTAENMAKHRGSEYYDFWKNIKVGYDYFEITHRPPEVEVCDKKYVFNQVAGANARFNANGACPASTTPPALASAYQSYSKTYETAFAAASSKYGQSDWKDTPEFDRKAADRLARRMGKVKKIPNDAEYVLLDPNAKITPTSDTVTSYAAAYAKVEEIKSGAPPKVEYISVAEVEARKKEAAERAKAEAKLAKELAKSTIPVPEPNPLKPVMVETETASAGDTGGKPFWSFLARKTRAGRIEANADPAMTSAAMAPAPLVTGKIAAKNKTDDKTQPAVVPAPVTPPLADAEQQAKKPFWKIW